MLKTKIIFKQFNQILGMLIISNLFLSVGSSSALAEREQSKIKTVDSDFGLPTHRRDGGSRGSRDNCVANADNQNLTALIPQKTVGINSSASPKLFFYVPEVSNRRTLEFVLRNERDELMYEAFLTTSGKGIMAVEIPANLHPDLLETEQNYHWYLSMICNDRQRSRDIVVEGWMRQEQIDPMVEEQLNNASPIEQAKVYQDRGFWYDALSVLAANDLGQQPMVKQQWFEMLESVGLEELSSKPFVETELIQEAVPQ